MSLLSQSLRSTTKRRKDLRDLGVKKAAMDYKKSVTFFFLLALLILPLMLFPATAATGGIGGMEVYCGSRCRGRCAKAGFQDRCIKYCVICCRQCKCVPSGTFGNKHQCPCYRDKLNSKGKPKCP